jgi:hydrogenase expression/formation protein HypC
VDPPADPAHCDTGQDGGCITCGDVAVPMRVHEVDAAGGLALCEDPAGGLSWVEVALVPAPAPGGLLLVHAGTAIAALEPEEAL